MDVLKTIQKIFLMALAVPAVVCSLLAQTNPTTPVWGTPVNGLQIGLSQDTSAEPPSQTPALRLALQNVGTNDLTVIWGGGCGDHGTNGVGLIVTDSSGASKQLVVLGPAGCGGGIGISSRTLAPGGAFSIPIMLDSYRIRPTELSSIKDGTYLSTPKWQPGGTYTLQAEIDTDAYPSSAFPTAKWVKSHPADAQGRPIFWWLGTVTSNQLKIQLPAP